MDASESQEETTPAEKPMAKVKMSGAITEWLVLDRQESHKVQTGSSRNQTTLFPQSHGCQPPQLWCGQPHARILPAESRPCLLLCLIHDNWGSLCRQDVTAIPTLDYLQEVVCMVIGMQWPLLLPDRGGI